MGRSTVNGTEETPTANELWAGIGRKVDSAWFHFERMDRELQPPELTPHQIVMQSTGTTIGRNWHRAFYAHFDAFLSTARSVPELIRCCFGVDDRTSVMKNWFKSLDQDEQKRRRDFGTKFKAEYDGFHKLVLSTARNINDHRTGSPPVTVTVIGHFGMIYQGGPNRLIPSSEMRHDLPPEYSSMARSVAVEPTWKDFEIDGEPLYEICNDYLLRARGLAARGRELAQKVHGTGKITSPPSDL